jgi:60 kDa SS-A/Ro ribonucleoprotein
LLAAYLNVEADMPIQITNALQQAMEHATLNIPQINGNIVVCVDVSGSMSSWTVTGDRGSASSKMKDIDVAALIGASILRKNPTARILPFEDDVVPAHRCKLNPYDSVMTNAQILRSVGGGATNCSAPLVQLNREQAKVDLVIFVSDNESWVDSGRGNYGYGYYGDVHRGTATMVEFQKIKARNPNAKMVCIDLTPNPSLQAIDREDILNIGGFSDTVFEVISEFAKAGLGRHWTDVIEAVKLD